MKKFLAVILALVFALSGMSVMAFAADKDKAQAPLCTLNKDGNAVNWFGGEDGEYYFFISDSDFAGKYTVTVKASGDVYLNGAKLEGNTFVLGSAEGTITSGGVDYKYHVVCTAKLPAVYITTESGSMDAVHADKSYKEAGTIRIYNEKGKTEYDGALDYIKGRGNSSWGMAKKPYNIKIAKKTNLFGMGKSKKWSLIANYSDNSHLRNAAVYYAAQQIGLDYTPKFVFCDVYTNGDYQGVYLLITRIEANSKRVDVANLDDVNEEIAIAASGNEDLDMDSLPQGGAYGRFAGLIEGTKKWVEIPEAPEGYTVDNTGGYILEMELANRYYGEKSGFVTTRSQPITMKSPEYASQAQMEYISDLYQRFEDAVFAGNGRNALGEHYTDIADLESLAKYYMISEWCSNMDSGLTSTYFYKPEGADSKLFAGPVWDYDIAFGNNEGTRYGCNYNNPEEFTVCFGRQYRNTVFGKLDVDYKPTIYNRLCRRPEFVEACRRLWDAGIGDKLAETAAEYIFNMSRTIKASAVADGIRWNIYGTCDAAKVAENYEVAAAYLEDFATARTRFLDVNLGRVQVQGKVKDQLPAGLRNFLVRVNNLFEAFIVNFKLINK